MFDIVLEDGSDHPETLQSDQPHVLRKGVFYVDSGRRKNIKGREFRIFAPKEKDNGNKEVAPPKTRGKAAREAAEGEGDVSDV